MLTFTASVNQVYSNITSFKPDASGHRQKSVWAKIPELQQEVNAGEVDFYFHFKVHM